MPERQRLLLPPIFRGIIACLCMAAGTAWADHTHGRDNGTPPRPQPPPFVASTEKPFPFLMDELMAAMDYGMIHAPVNGEPDHDFVIMMIPHHQGAIDMAKALLLYGKDPELRNLALQIIADQQGEIQLMQAWLKRRQSAEQPAAQPPNN